MILECIALKHLKLILCYLAIGAALVQSCPAEDATLGNATRVADSLHIGGSPLFIQTGTDPAFEALMARDKLEKEKSSKIGVTGSAVHVKLPLVETFTEAKRPIPEAINLHTLLNSSIPRHDFGQWSRWYQEDGHTQVFRLFKGEMNLHNDRPLSARVETFSHTHWTESEGTWHEWSGVITGIRPAGSIFQVKDSIDGPAVMILMSADGTVTLNRRRGKDEVIATNMNGKPFLLCVRDNGLNYEVFFNGKMAGDGVYKRPKGKTSFRWGMYVGEHELKYDAMLFVSGAAVDGKN